MKSILIAITILFASPLLAEKKSSDANLKKLWEEVLAEKKQYEKMKKDGASEKELALQEKLIKELYNEMITQKKEIYGKDFDKKGDKKDFKGNKAWQEMLKAKKECGVMEKEGASKEVLAEQKKKIMELYKKAKSEK